MLPRCSVGVIAACCLFLAAGCGLLDRTDSENRGPQSIPSMAEEARELGYVEQHDVLRDGKVTESEYRATVDRVISCLEDAGADVVGDLYIDPYDSLSITGYRAEWDLPEDEAVAAADECSVRYESYVVDAYLRSHDAKMASPMRRALAACLENRGLELTGNEEAEQDFHDAIGDDGFERYQSCFSEAYEDYMEGPGPEFIDR